MRLVIDCSPEQMDVIADHLLDGKEIGMLPDERHWMMAQARKKFPKCKILGADLDVMNGEWVLEINEG